MPANALKTRSVASATGKRFLVWSPYKRGSESVYWSGRLIKAGSEAEAGFKAQRRLRKPQELIIIEV